MLVVTKYVFMLSSAHSIIGDIIEYTRGASFNPSAIVIAGQLTDENLKQEPQRVVAICPRGTNDMRSIASAVINFQSIVIDVLCYGSSGAEVEEMSDAIMARYRSINKFGGGNNTPFYSIIATGGMGYRYSTELDWHAFSTSYRIIYAGKRAIN